MARAAARTAPAIEVQGVRVSHPDKVLWPADGITKLDLVRYYERIAPALLPYVARRPLTLRPFPEGIDRPGFYLKDAPRGAPRWLETFRDIAASTGEPIDFVVAHDARTLVWMAQYNAIEVHPWLSRIDRPDHPDWAVVDLDPPDDPSAGSGEAAPDDAAPRAALLVRDQLERVGLRAFAKPTGQTGIHVLVPLAREHTFDQVRAFFQRLAEALAAAHPDLLTTDYRVADRYGRILIDYAQNARGKTTVGPYSVRPRPGAPVAAPVTWDELADPAIGPETFTIRDVPARLERVGDPWRDWRAHAGSLEAARGLLG
jgi:bifunctional non-homologous end joining protein LigD